MVMTTAKKTARKSARKKKIRAKFQNLGLLLKSACLMAEEMGGTGEEKKKWVVDTINKKLDIPLLNEDQEEIVLELMVDIVCDLIFSRYDAEYHAAVDVFKALQEK
jgi:hypothetical protein|tara:strand:- start:1296 stop:1613 length:318 start_codon:yes stop_codon:yes gene_type:complete